MNKMAEETKEMFAENDEAAVYVSSSQPTNKRLTMTSIDYLNARQQVGRSTFVTRAGRMKLQPSNMAYSLAWNPSRMQNMSLVIGPGTPATAIMTTQGSLSDDDDSSADYSIHWNDDNNEDESSDSDEYEDLASGMEGQDAYERQVLLATGRMGDTHMAETNASSSSSSSDDTEPRSRRRARQSSRNETSAGSEWVTSAMRRSDHARNPTRVSSPHREAFVTQLEKVRRRLRAREMAPSMRHSGCINTACWLDVPWRLSTINEQVGVLRTQVVESDESPTQLATSGDDRLLKIWDCSGAMGSDNPIPGGWNTLCPFSTQDLPDNDGDFVQQWKDYYSERADCHIGVPGTTRMLGSMCTGHRGNVFHVTPLATKPGQFLTCAADGVLRLIDLVTDRSTIVVHPYVEVVDRNGGIQLTSLSAMAYSHVMLNQNTGLLCSERGLHVFDIRLSPREQNTQSILKKVLDDEPSWRTGSCKSCAVWNPHATDDKSVESMYVFAGGASETVGLYDLRMDASKGRIIQRYKPGTMRIGEGNVSVSGIDVSKDSRELLVSYESDQIYTFPILQDTVCPAGPTMEVIDLTSMHFSSSSDHCISELASYGGHLNRLTFLKNAKYAGPNDDYICTGSDSGHAWIFDRSSGTVVSLLGADRSTCNGAVPHPSLPYLITYGIESTAKLWRASTPIDSQTDNSPVGRLKCSLLRKYEMSPVTRMWDGVQALLGHFEPEQSALPDYIASSDEIAATGGFRSPSGGGIGGPNTPRIGNALLQLPSILRQNQYECYRSLVHDVSAPVELPLIDFTHRISISRLKHQADRLGMRWDPWNPFVFRSYKARNVHPHLAELVPDFPSDWINYDNRVVRHVLCPRRHYNVAQNEDLLAKMIPGFLESMLVNDPSVPWLTNGRIPRAPIHLAAALDVPEYEARSREMLYRTALICKEGGNDAMKANLLQAAARRYDKAIQYLAVAIMSYAEGNATLEHLECPYHETVIVDDGKATWTYPIWSEPLKLLILCRLNLALLLLKKEFSQPQQAANQARDALKLLSPFCGAEGKIRCVRGKSTVYVKDDEPSENYRESKSLQAKAYFRLGSAELEIGDYAAAIKSFELSLVAAKLDPNYKKPDALTVKRLEEAKHKHKLKKKRIRNKYQRLLESESQGEGEAKEDRTTVPESSTDENVALSQAVTPDSAPSKA